MKQIFTFLLLKYKIILGAKLVGNSILSELIFRYQKELDTRIIFNVETVFLHV